MAALLPLPNTGSYNTKDLIIFLAKKSLAAKMSTQNADKIPANYLAKFALSDYQYARALQALSQPEALIKSIAIANALITNINNNAKAKTEYKLYSDQLTAALKKAEEERTALKMLTADFKGFLTKWHENNQDIAEQVLRPGVSIKSPVMKAPLEKVFKPFDELLHRYQDIQQIAESARTALNATITTTQNVVPYDIVGTAMVMETTKESTINKP